MFSTTTLSEENLLGSAKISKKKKKNGKTGPDQSKNTITPVAVRLCRRHTHTYYGEEAASHPQAPSDRQAMAAFGDPIMQHLYESDGEDDDGSPRDSGKVTAAVTAGDLLGSVDDVVFAPNGPGGTGYGAAVLVTDLDAAAAAPLPPSSMDDFLVGLRPGAGGSFLPSFGLPPISDDDRLGTLLGPGDGDQIQFYGGGSGGGGGDEGDGTGGLDGSDMRSLASSSAATMTTATAAMATDSSGPPDTLEELPTLEEMEGVYTLSDPGHPVGVGSGTGTDRHTPPPSPGDPYPTMDYHPTSAGGLFPVGVAPSADVALPEATRTSLRLVPLCNLVDSPAFATMTELDYAVLSPSDMVRGEWN